MKQVIDGKMYNTETAKHIGNGGSRGYSTSDFNYYNEDLYKTKRGNFFLAGEGHAFTKYASSCGNCRGYGSAIIPLTKEEALEWCEHHCQEVIEDTFEIEEA